jgi:hypothetical protein
MAHITAARNDERALIFKIILRRPLLVRLQLHHALQPLDERQPPLSRSNFLATVGRVCLQRNAGQCLTAVTAFQHLRRNRDTVGEIESLSS